MKNAWSLRQSASAVLIASFMGVIGLSGCVAPNPTRASAQPSQPSRSATTYRSSASEPLGSPPARAGTTVDLAPHMRRHAPLRYIVQPGDTLWAIAGRYLDDPWYWPRLWQANPDITNPGRIYPGDVLILTYDADGQPWLTGQRTVHLSPKVREQPLADAIPTIPYAAIRDFLNSPQLVDAQTLESAPYAVSFDDQHLVAGRGAVVYIRGLGADAPDTFQLVRHDGAYQDAATGRVLGQQALPIGQVTLTRRASDGAISTGVIDSSTREALPGDRLLPLGDLDQVRDFHPQAPARALSARIIAVYGGMTAIGQYDVVTLDQGEQDGLSRGDVLNVFEAGRRVPDPITGHAVTLPPVYAGQLMVFKTEAQVSFALIMQARRAIHLRDVARSPAV